MDAVLVAGWKDLCRRLAPAFTAPTLVTFLPVAAGWVLCRSRPAVTGIVLTVGTRLLGHAAKHWTAYERFFYRAAWSLEEVSRLLLVRVADGRGAGVRQDGAQEGAAGRLPLAARVRVQPDQAGDRPRPGGQAEGRFPVLHGSTELAEVRPAGGRRAGGREAGRTAGP